VCPDAEEDSSSTKRASVLDAAGARRVKTAVFLFNDVLGSWFSRLLARLF